MTDHATHAVFATTAEGERVRVTDPASWNETQYAWQKLDENWRAWRFPHVQYFEVRSMDDLGYRDAPTSLSHGEPLDPSLGFSNYRDAARRAWRMWQGDKTPTGATQGTGGWFYWHNGRTAAQGMSDLESLARRRGLVVQGVDGRYYPKVSAL